MRWLDGIIDSMDMSLSKLRDSEGQGSLKYCSTWGCKESDMTEQLNNSNTPEEGQALFLTLVCDFSQQAPIGP